MISPGNILRELQDEVYHRLLSEALLAPVSIFRERAGEVTEEQIAIALSTLNTRAGKQGAVVLVLMPRVVTADQNSPGPRFQVGLVVRVLVQPLFNDDATSGTGLTEDELGLCVLHALHYFKPGGLAPLMLADKANPVEPYTAALDAGVAGYDVSLTLPWGLAGDDKCRAVAIAGTAAAVTLTCAVPAGAAIYYTTDGSYPGSGNAAASLYAGAFSVQPGTTVRASAEHDDYAASDISFSTL